MEKIVFLDRQTLPARLRARSFPHLWQDYDQTPESSVVARLEGATIAITNKTPLRERTLSQLPSLKLIVVAATGVDNVDLAFCTQRNVVVCNVPGYTVASVPEHVFMLMLALRRNLLAYRNAVEEGRWQRSPTFALFDYPVASLKGATLGIVGFGSLGKEVARLANAFGMTVLLAERKGVTDIRPGRLAFEDVLRRSDILSVHAPLVPQTRQLFGMSEFALMKPGSLFLNTSRGGLIDEAALAQALRSGHLGGAGIDVLSKEPPSAENPLLASDVPNLIVTPHIAWASDEALARLAETIVSNLEAFVAGAPMNRVA